jgi:NTP pyrophosphatase (non-canonical NTP hydrolase)
MTFDEYQEKSRETAVYPDQGDNFVYPTLGLVGEAGEIAEKVKKVIRDNGGKLDEERKVALTKELGDVLWYLSQLATELKVSLNEIADINIKKLQDRHQRDAIKGSGDDR